MNDVSQSRFPSNAATTAELCRLGLFLLATLRVVFHLVANWFDSYGIFRDEFYYLACSRHLAWGYVDHPPLSAFLLALQTAVFGDSLFALRILPALAGGASVFLVGAIAREFGAKRYGQMLAGMFAFFVPSWLAFAGYYSMNVLDLVFWAAIVLVAAKLIRARETSETGRPGWRLWAIFGGLVGLGILNKLSVLWLVAALGISLILSPQRRLLLTRGRFLGAGIVIVLVAPFVYWQVSHGWPTLEFIHNAQTYKNTVQTPLSFLAGVMLEMNPAMVLLWILGLVYLFLPGSKAPGQGGSLRWAGLTAVIVLAYLTLSKTAKPYYADTTFVLILPAAACACESWFGGRLRFLKVLVPIHAVVSGCIVLPFALPILPPERYVAYADRLGISEQNAERSELGALPQFYADRFGWEELARDVSDAYSTLSPDEQKLCAVYARNYGQAGALEYFRKTYPLPPVLCGHNNYWYWGPGDATGAVMITLNSNREQLEELFDSVELYGTHTCTWCMPFENDYPIWICRGMRVPIEEIWARQKEFI
ncbi:MAG: glycosyltransferase family 39 protein [Candidatus Eisenbacteria bacterium]|uniref:Glycosyltransferase family 39 protein n=1 Tax=Eiseniibacteriota bacterium TaxID=2212470 RepID=A0A956SE39_UNCEI|nr:glycosyltransferase family 39 protein [Candidatus Eisenbacteria bacterium]